MQRDNCHPAPYQLSVMSIWKAAILIEAFRCFLQFLQTNVGILPYTGLRTFPSQTITD